MTVHVLGEVKVAEVAAFLEVFSTEGLAKREEHGCRGTQVFAPTGESDRVLVLLEFDSAADFESFRTDPDAPPIMRRGGAQGPPSFTVTERVGAYDH